ncbi:adenine-specific DNA methyltransferase [Mesomycoplasma dispar]|uniref:Adenine-specific DNA methyltransferase n=1 Tax=Mesomycoplasma dispar TaxID=86660 RepID=A0AAJ5TCP3_9BACT|nr:DNA adenine methylase [Mesomycoplasma dispar]VEU62057.1 adenine-specific DNA methyltransferase [Mesomycoplasma dispar]
MKIENRKNKINPVLKWVGGKRQLLDRIIPLVPEKFNNYIEPFFGGGALFFSLEPSTAIINDFNTELINTYQVIKNKPQELILELEEHQKFHSKNHFYEIRNLDRQKTLIKLAMSKGRRE